MSIYFMSDKIRRNLLIISIPPIYQPDCNLCRAAASTIFCTQYRKDDWVKRLGEGVRAEAIVDRYAYTAFWIETGSTNMREYCANSQA